MTSVNIYDNPEKFGLEIFVEHDDPNADYSFNKFVIWEHEDGRLFYAQDSGCSCPSPFEDCHKLKDLTELKKENMNEFITSFETYCEDCKIPLKDKMKTIKQVEDYFKQS